MRNLRKLPLRLRILGISLSFFPVANTSLLAQQSQNNTQLELEDPSQLVGKKIDVQRLPLCEPGTYKTDLEHAGMIALVLSVQPSRMSAPLSKSALDRLPPSTRDMIADQQKAGVLLLQFDDGTKRDTCAPMSPKMLSGYIELGPGETLSTVPAPQPETDTAKSPHAERPAVLSDAEVNSALTGKGRDHWVRIEDQV